MVNFAVFGLVFKFLKRNVKIWLVWNIFLSLFYSEKPPHDFKNRNLDAFP